MSRLLRIGFLLVLALGSRGATLEYLSLDDMAANSTAIVRGRMVSAATRSRGSL